MNNVYKILEKIEDHFNNEPNTNSVTFGSFNETNLKKQDLFPMCQFNIGSIEYVGNTIDFTVNMMVLDVVDEGKEFDGSFKGSTNLQDVLNTQAMVLNKLVESLREGRGDLSEDQLVLKEDPIAEYLYEEFENKLAGWGMDIQIRTVNDVSVC
tara:strand:- start:544 stop:1002 length:459 start_codon:yes stop_codon:yes gene_type:complete